MLNVANRMARGLISLSRFTECVPSAEWNDELECYQLVVGGLSIKESGNIFINMVDLNWYLNKDMEWVFPMTSSVAASQQGDLYSMKEERVT